MPFHLMAQPFLLLCCFNLSLPIGDSFKRVGQPGPLTRLMSCSEEQLKDYKWLDLMPTFVAPNVAHDALHDDWYQPYNKPTAVHYWLRVSHSSQPPHKQDKPLAETTFKCVLAHLMHLHCPESQCCDKCQERKCEILP